MLECEKAPEIEKIQFYGTTSHFHFSTSLHPTTITSLTYFASPTGMRERKKEKPWDAAAFP